MSKVTKFLSYTALACVIICAAFSLKWRVCHDTPIMLYISRLIFREGVIPYREIFDMNQPLSYLMLSVPGFFGDGIGVAARLYDLFLLGIISVFTYKWLSFLSAGRYALLGVCLFSLRYFSGVWAFCLQREFLALLPLSLLILVVLEERGSLKFRAVSAGVLVALTVLIKPQFVLYAIPCLWLLSGRFKSIKQFGSVCFYMGIGGLIPIIIAMGWLFSIGALHDYIDIGRYYLPLYGRMNGAHAVVPFAERVYASLRGLLLMVLSPYAVFGVLGLTVGALHRREDGFKFFFLLQMTFVSMIIVCLSGQFWAYHKLHFYYFMLVSGAIIFADIKLCKPEKYNIFWKRAFLVLGVVAITGLSAMGLIRSYNGSFSNDSLLEEKLCVADDLSAYLRKNLKEGDTVQPLDWTGGAVHAMLIANAMPGTKFLYTFHFYHHVSNPYTVKLRAEFIEELSANRPAYLLEILQQSFPRGLDSSLNFPELDILMKNEYAVVEATERYRVWHVLR